MCHYTVEACGNDHEVSKRRKYRHCSSWEEGVDSESCTYEAALKAGEVKRESVQTRVCEQCVREIIKDMKAEDEKFCKEEAVESKEERSGHKRDLVNDNMEAISKTDENKASPRNAESSNQLHIKGPIFVESVSVKKAAKELAETEDAIIKSKILLDDVGSLELQDLERKAGPSVLSHALQKITNNQANQTNTKRLANTTKKQSLRSKSYGAPNIKRVSEYKLKSIPEPDIVRQREAQEDATEAATVDNEQDAEDEVEEEELITVVKKEKAYEQENEKKEETDELDQCLVIQSGRPQAPTAARRGRSTGRGFKGSMPVNDTPTKRGRAMCVYYTDLCPRGDIILIHTTACRDAHRRK
ncbi:uncharacterized protein Bfra_008365 [Botrytis fragariae]|uniref:Uncharacterized protein n=1 Tax=Botrytis fragariae TaxID=1964551 RepID=A0A8H6AT37_9HELO|nr:uncharacterized protein Bfra_008365 [Botrytis fragariae]KAF5873088.1 hypothetical protein Bfra_008365 [Botrytis fragariae]